MKYQVYLNKETSHFIELVAEQEGKKPNTVIKGFIEGLYKAGMMEADRLEAEMKAQMLKEAESNGNGKH